MSSPFPGMNPYLEKGGVWRGFHQYLAVEIASRLNASLDTRYFADIEVRTVWEQSGIIETTVMFPDAAVFDVLPETGGVATLAPALVAPIQRVALPRERYKERTVAVRETNSGDLVTAIEILSPVNKRGKYLDEYQEKRRIILESNVHLIELDFLRGGKRPGWEVNHPPIDCDYIILVNRGFVGNVRRSEIWPVDINETLPMCPVPLLPPDADVRLDLGAVMRSIYERAAYTRRIDYREPVPPPRLRPAMVSWWDELRSVE